MLSRHRGSVPLDLKIFVSSDVTSYMQFRLLYGHQGQYRLVLLISKIPQDIQYSDVIKGKKDANVTSNCSKLILMVGKKRHLKSKHKGSVLDCIWLTNQKKVKVAKGEDCRSRRKMPK